MYSMDDTDELGANAPKPIDSASVDKGGFERLSRKDGAVRARRGSSPRHGAGEHVATGSHAQSTPMVRLSRRTLVGLVVAAVAVIVLCVALFVRVLTSPVPGSEALSDEAVPGAAEQEESASAEIGYELRESGGSYALVEVRTEGGAQEVVVGSLPGQPVDLVMYQGTILIPENLSDGTWEVSAYTNDGSWTPIASQDGQAVGGKGTISEASLDGSSLRLVVDGETVEVPLEW